MPGCFIRAWALSTVGSAGAVRLHAVQPNPCARSAQIRFDLAQPGLVRLEVYNGAGRLVREVLSGWQSGGTHTATWDGRNRAGTRVASGVYVVRLQSAGHDGSVRMVLIP